MFIITAILLSTFKFVLFFFERAQVCETWIQGENSVRPKTSRSVGMKTLRTRSRLLFWEGRGVKMPALICDRG